MGAPPFMATVYTILRKDIQSELRSKQTVVTMLLFGVVLTMVFAFSFVTDPRRIEWFSRRSVGSFVL